MMATMNDLVTWSEYEADEESRPVAGRYCITKDDTFTDTWQGFADSIVHEVGPKQGSCFVLALFDWSKSMGGRLRRLSTNVVGAPAVAAIDSDGLTDEQAKLAWQFIVRSGWSAVAYSTHSYGRADKPGCRMRLFVLLDRPQTPDEIPAVRRGLGSLLGTVAGVPWDRVVDSKALDKARMFFWPRCAPERQQSAFVWRTDGANRASVDLMVQLCPPGVEDPPEVTDLAVQGHPAQIEAALVSLDHLCRDIANCSQGLYRYTGQATYHFGRFIAAGLLNERETLEKLFAAVAQQRANHGDNANTTAERHEQIRRGITEGIRKGPVWPLNGAVDGEGALAVAGNYRGRKELESRLQAQTPTLRYPAHVAQDLMHKFLRQPRIVGTPWVGVVRIPPGVGKSYTNQRYATERADSAQNTLILAPRQDLCRQIVLNLEAIGHKPFHMYSAMQPAKNTGGAECLRIDEPLIQSLLKRGASVPATECQRCPKRDVCQAKDNGNREPKNHQRIIVAPFASAIKAADKFDGDFEIICDEEPDADETIEFSPEDLTALRESPALRILKKYQADAIRDLIDARLAGEQTPPEHALEKAERSWGQLHIDTWSPDFEKHYGDVLDQMRDVLKTAPYWAQTRWDGKVWRTKVPHPIWQLLQENGGYVMSATITPQLYTNLETRRLDLPVADFHTTTRIMAYTCHANRRQVIPNGSINWELVKRDLQEAFRLTKDCGRILIITYKKVADALRTTHRHLVSHHQTEVTHYEKVVGMDMWASWDAVVSMYDARTPPAIRDDGSYDWEQSSGNARRMATQGHGRTRDAQQRTSPAMHVVIGKEPPEDWGNDNCVVAWRQLGAPPGLMPQDIMEALVELRARLGLRAAARAINVPFTTLADWLKRSTAPKPDKLDVIRALLKENY